VAIVLVGNDRDKLSRLIDLVKSSSPGCPHGEPIVVFNGDAEFEGATRTDNVGWDLGMYAIGVEISNGEWNFFLNDDVVHVSDGWYANARQEMEKVDILGQPNLQSWCVHEKVEPRHRKVRFIRTHAFACKTAYFKLLLHNTEKNRLKGKHAAHIFEKSTLSCTRRYAFFPNPAWIYDSNTAPHVEAWKDADLARRVS
jgi:hypothetical protein